MIIVSDTSPLCNLQLVNSLWLLRELYGIVIIPHVVAEELAAASNPDIQNICNLEWIQIGTLSLTMLAERLQRERGLDPGEAEAIALAIELKADDLLIDERLGRREALQLGLSVIGVLGILYHVRIISYKKPFPFKPFFSFCLLPSAFCLPSS